MQYYIYHDIDISIIIIKVWLQVHVIMYVHIYG